MNVTFEKLRAILDETDERYHRLIVIPEGGLKRPNAWHFSDPTKLQDLEAKRVRQPRCEVILEDQQLLT